MRMPGGIMRMPGGIMRVPGGIVRITLTAVGLALMLCAAPDHAFSASAEDMTKAEHLKKTALELLKAGEYSKALPMITEVLSIAPDDPTAKRYLSYVSNQVVEPYCKQAADSYLAGRSREAIKYWENILKINPDDSRVIRLIDDTVRNSNRDAVAALYGVVEKLIKTKRYSEAVGEIEKILEIDPDDSRAKDLHRSTKKTMMDIVMKERYGKAEELMKRKEYDLAVEELNEVLRVDPKQELASRLISEVQRKKLESMYGEARELYESGNYVAAREQFAQIIASNPADADVKATIERLNKVSGIVPKVDGKGEGWDAIRKALDHYVSEAGNPKVSVTASRYAAQLEPTSSIIGTVRDFLERELSSAVMALPNPVSDMNIIDQYLFIALNHIYEGRYDQAVQECGIVLEIQPRNILAMKRLGSAYFAMGLKPKAKEIWERALKVDPSDAELRRFIEQAKTAQPKR